MGCERGQTRGGCGAAGSWRWPSSPPRGFLSSPEAGGTPLRLSERDRPSPPGRPTRGGSGNAGAGDQVALLPGPHPSPVTLPLSSSSLPIFATCFPVPGIPNDSTRDGSCSQPHRGAGISGAASTARARSCPAAGRLLAPSCTSAPSQPHSPHPASTPRSAPWGPAPRGLRLSPGPG